MLDSNKFWMTLIILVTLILMIGWNQPLSYRFMAEGEIKVAEEGAATPTPTPAPGSWMWDRERATKLDRGDYGRRMSDGWSARGH
jgi:hypothetical protein